MPKTIRLLSLVGVTLLCGCDKQTKINSAKIDLLSRNIIQYEQNQSKQMAVVQSQLTSLAPMLDKMNDFYFEKSHDEAFFFHTNTLYLLLTVDKKIEAHLQLADTERESQNALAYSYYTNQMGALYAVQDALAVQETNIENKVNAETLRIGGELLQQIRLATPDAAEVARRQQLAADAAEIKRVLGQIELQIGQMTNRILR
ncbi:MAG TPA: hypothetical protein VIK62_06525 [Verrucomicrobiae bacterium]